METSEETNQLTMNYSDVFDNLTEINRFIHFGGDKCNGGNDIFQLNEVGTFDIVLMTFEFLQSILCFTTNLMTLLAVLKNAKLRTLPNAYVIALATADMLSGALLLYEFFLQLPGIRHTLNESYYLCLSVFYFVAITMYESILIIALMSFERFMYICYPYQYERMFSTKTVKISIAISWLISFIIPTMTILYSQNKTFKGCVYGILSGDYYYYVIGLGFYLALVVCFCFHVNILRVAALHRKRIACMTVGQNSTKYPKSPVAQHWRLIQSFLLVYTLSYLCWFPWVTCAVLRTHYCISEKLMDLLSLLGVSSGTLNFLVYGLFNEEFRKTFKQLMFGKCQSRNFEERVGFKGSNTKPVNTTDKATSRTSSDGLQVLPKNKTSLV